MSFAQDDLQIPATLRPKLNGMDNVVKTAMLKSSHSTNITAIPPQTPRMIRKAHSSESLVSPPKMPQIQASSLDRSASPVLASNAADATRPTFAQRHMRGISFDYPRSTTALDLPGKPASKDRSTTTRAITPLKFCSVLTGTSSTRLELEMVKKLRICLRNEPAEFVKLGFGD